MLSAGPRGVRPAAWLYPLFLLLVALFLTIPPVWGQIRPEMLRPASGRVPLPDQAVAGQALVIAQPGTSTQDLQAALAAKGCVLLKRWQVGGGNTALVGLPQGMTVAEGVALLRTAARIRLAEPNRLLYPMEVTGLGATFAGLVRTRATRPAATPNDPRYSQQYQWPLCSFPLAWDVTTGSTTNVVAVIDSGLDVLHQDLAPKLWTNPRDGSHGYNFVEDSTDLTDVMEHGTHVAGLIGAATNNSLGVAGADWGCRLMGLKVFDDDTGLAPADAIISAIQYAIDNGARVINMSLGTAPGGYSEIFTQPITDAFNAGLIVVVAAGNNGFTFTDDSSMWSSPVCNDGALESDNHVLGVAACDSQKRIAEFSNLDGSSRRFVDVVAPGVSIISTLPGNAYGGPTWSGTSMAAPITAGLASLVVSQFGTSDPAKVIQTIRTACTNLDADNPSKVGLMGAGLINAVNSLVIPPPQPARSVQAFGTPNTEGGSITVTWTRSPDDGAGFDTVVKYDLLRAEQESGPFSLLQSFPATGKSNYSHLDTPVPNGVPYWYRVDTCSDTDTVPSAVAGPATASDTLAPEPVETLKAVDTPNDRGGSITLTWTGYTTIDPNLVKFRIYRDTVSFTEVSAMTPIATVADKAARSYVDKTTTDGVNYWYAVTGVDAVDNENKQVTPVGPVQSLPNLSLTFPMGLSLIALPLMPQDANMGHILNIGGPVPIRLAAWDTTTDRYVEYADDPTNPLLQQALGRAFWLRTGAPLKVALTGKPAPPGDFAVPLVPDWNMIGNPFSAEVVFSQCQIVVAGTPESLDTSNANGHTDNYAWSYDNVAQSYRLVSAALPFAARTIKNGQGFFFRSHLVASLLLKRPTGALQVSEDKPPPPTEDNWTLRLVAQAGTAADTDNFLGISPQASSFREVLSPPLLEGGVDLFFRATEGGSAATSFRKPGADPTWDLQVATAQAGAEVILTWPDLSTLPNSVRPILTDLATGRSFYLRTVPSYRFRAGDQPRQFRLSLAPEGPVMLSSVTTNGGLGRGEIVYVLAAPAQVTVEVLSISGRLVRTVAANSVRTAGIGTVIWDGRNLTGAAAPAGTYLVRVTAESDTGQRVSVVRALLLRR